MPAAVVILAAGSGTRMKSARPKALHEIGGAPMLWHVVKAAESAAPERVIVVTGRDSLMVRERLERFGLRPEFVVQAQPLGTADAVAAARGALEGFSGTVIVLNGDTPLIRPATLDRLVKSASGRADLTVVGFHTDSPGSYGRLVNDEDGSVVKIVEFRDADADERRITHCNSGILAVDAGLLFDLISCVRPDNAAGELYLTDIVNVARSKGLRCHAVSCGQAESSGINTRSELAAAEAGFQSRARAQAIDSGAILLGPETVFFSFDTRLATDCTVEPFVVFGPGVSVDSGARVRSHSHLEGCSIRSGAIVGPFARIRPETVVEPGAKVGNFVETKAARISEAAKAPHLSYIGDTEIGAGANIGAGTVTCNYDGKAKHRTLIGPGAFVGSGSILVAPVEIGEAAMTAAGSVITSDVPPGSLGVARSRQSIIKGFTKRFFAASRLRKKNGG